MSGRPDVAVVVPHRDDAARLARCLAALAPQAAGAEVVVVDNASAVDLGPLAAAHPWARFLVEPRRGAAHARNRGAAETAAPALFFLDCDCVPDPDWLAAGRAALARADVVGGAVALFDETPPPRSGAEAFETVFAFDQKAYVERKGFSVSANLLIRRPVFEAVGGFAPDVSEDLDWCRRATARGFRLVYAPEVRVAHPTRSDMAALARKFRRVTAESYALTARTPAARAAWALRAAAMLASPLAHGPRLLASPRLRGPGERLRGLAALVGLRARRAGWMLAQALTDRP